MKKIHYKTKLNFSHYIKNEPKLFDKQCEKPHDHESVIVITVPLQEDEFLDFKVVKNATEKVLDGLQNKNITDIAGLGMTEELVDYLSQKIGYELKKKIDVYIQETHKYGMDLVSD